MKRRNLALGFALLCGLVLSGGRALPAADAIEAFNGKDLAGWKVRADAARGPSKWVVGTAQLKPGKPRELVVVPGGKELINAAASTDLYTEGKFGDCHVELEVMVPKDSNSGIYMMGVYEIQVLDSFGKKRIDATDMGAIYGKTAPKVNASLPRLAEVRHRLPPAVRRRWQEGCQRQSVRCTLNGQLILENAEINGPTGLQLTGEVPTGPLMLQGNHGPVAVRNITIQPR